MITFLLYFFISFEYILWQLVIKIYEEEYGKVPGVPIMYIHKHKYAIEGLPQAFGGKY